MTEYKTIKEAKEALKTEYHVKFRNFHFLKENKDGAYTGKYWLYRPDGEFISDTPLSLTAVFKLFSDTVRADKAKAQASEVLQIETRQNELSIDDSALKASQEFKHADNVIKLNVNKPFEDNEHKRVRADIEAYVKRQQVRKALYAPKAIEGFPSRRQARKAGYFKNPLAHKAS